MRCPRTQHFNAASGFRHGGLAEHWHSLRICPIREATARRHSPCCFGADVTGALLQPRMPGRSLGPILIVDDNEAVRQALVVYLHLHGYDTVTADNGAQALTVLQSLRVGPSMILLDLMMPVMDGVEFRN